MPANRWLDTTQPQTLVIAVVLLYINAVFLILFGGFFSLIGLVLVLGQIGGGYGIANEKKWGYGLGIAMAVLPFVYRLAVLHNPFGGVDIITVMFEIALVALLLHPQSREYQRIWFK
ncbi:MAG TPA: hypothetical protein VHT75_16920 [Acidimicrobiales bacterium]|jgi:hypothetical protein|nr:hypothetical protein [Acidimicrobiales bacterium]